MAYHATKKLQDYSPSLSAEMKSPAQIFLFRNEFYKHKKTKNKLSNYLWYKFLTLA